MKTSILATGMSGLVGTRIMEILSDQFEFDDLSLTTGIDITNHSLIEEEMGKNNSKIVIHMAAKTDVDGCEDEKILGEESTCWVVNVVGTENIVSSALKTGKKIIYISTDFVFDGTKDEYTEDDIPNPVNWYGDTKYEGESIIQKSGIDYLIIRIAYPYRSYFKEKKDFVRRIIDKLNNKEKIAGLTDHILTPTFIDDIAFGLGFLIKHNYSGIFHLVGSQSIKVYDAIETIADIFGYKADIYPTTRKEYFKDKAFRPFKLALNNDKITKLGVRMRSFDEGLKEMKTQINKINK